MLPPDTLKDTECAHPLFLEHVTPVSGPVIVADVESGAFRLVVTRIDAANHFELRPQARRARFQLSLQREGKVLRQFVVGNDADPDSPPSVAGGLDGEFFVAWPDRSKNAPGVGVSGGGSYTVLDEERFTRITPASERIDAVLVTERTARSAGAIAPPPDAALFPQRRYFNLRLAFWEGRFWALTDERRGLTLWHIDAQGQLDAPQPLDAQGHFPHVAVSAHGQLGIAYLREDRPDSAQNWVPPVPVFLEFRAGEVFAASFAAPKSFFPLALASEGDVWWWVGRHDAEWPQGDYRAFYSGEPEPSRSRFLRFASVNTKVALPIEALPPQLENVEALSTRLAREWELESVRSPGAGELVGSFSREQDRFQFRVNARCQAPVVTPCEGKVVSRALGGVGNLPLHDGFLRLREADSEFWLERVDARGTVLWSQLADFVEDVRLSKDGTRVFAARSGRVKALSTSDGSELFSVQRRGTSGPCMTETEQGLVFGMHDQDSYTFELLDERGAATPLLELRGSYYQCAVAPWSRGVLIATSFDNEIGSNLGTRVRDYMRLNPQYWTRVAPYSMQGTLLGVPDAMPGGQPVAWREPGVAARGTHFVTALGTRNFAWHWLDEGRPSGKPSHVHLRYNDAPDASSLNPELPSSESPSPGLPSWDVWRGDDRACD